MKRLFIRADAGTRIGAGHFMRCLALAQAWKDAGGEVSFITACQNDDLLQRLREEGFAIHLLANPHPDPADWNDTKGLLTGFPDAWLVMDGYHFDETYQQRVKEAGNRLLVIDDIAHLKHYYADIVLNQNLHAEQLHYSGEPYTQLLLGTRYVLLRREFLAWRNWKREIPEVARRVLVTLGGSDPENHTLGVIQALQKIDIPGLEAVVVIGASNPHASVLETEVGKSKASIRLVRSARNMPELMAGADVAVASAGSTVWELAFLGVPTIAVATTLVEEHLIGGLQKHGLFLGLNWRNDFSIQQLGETLDDFMRDGKRRDDMSQLGQRLVDGNGCENMLGCLSKLKAAR